MPDRQDPAAATMPRTAGFAAALGRSLRRRREELGLSQAAVAEKVGHTQTWVSYIESGSREARLDDLDALLRALGMRLRLEVNRDA